MSDAAYHREYYAKRSPESKTRKVALQRKRRVEILARVRAYKEAHACAHCGKKYHHALMDFHHESDDKEVNVGSATRRGWSWERIQDEMSKCILLCSPCHRIHHWNLLHPDDKGSIYPVE